MHNKIPHTFTFISDFKKEEILKLDRNIGIIFRNYDKFPNKKILLELKNFCKVRKRSIYLSNNIKLSITLGFDGVYLPSFNKNPEVKGYNLKKNFIIMGSAHNLSEIKYKENQGVEIIFISPLFQTKNYKKKLDIIKFNILSQFTKKKIIALGGINNHNIKKLKMTNAYGFSGISYFKE